MHAPDWVADELAALASRSASGALQVSGEPGGTIYLSDGCLAFAESPGVPDLGSRLVNSRRLGVDQWRQANRDGHPDACAGDLLMRRGLIDEAEWQALLQSAALDALVALATATATATAEAKAGAVTSFTPQQAHCAGSLLCLDVARAWAHARQEAERLAGYHVDPDARPRLCGPARPRLAFGREAIAVLGQMDGRATVRELAWRNGLALSAVIDWAARLIEDGACTVAGLLPRGQAYADIRWTRPDPAVLRQILAELRQLG